MIRYLWKKNKLLFVLQVAFCVAMAAYLVYIPKRLGDLVDVLLGGQDVDIPSLLIGFAVVIVGGVAIMLPYRLSRGAYAVRQKKALEDDFAKKLIMRTRNQSDVMNIYNQEIALIQNEYLNQLLLMLSISVSFFFAMAMGAAISWELVLWIFGSTAVMLLVNQLFAKTLAKRTKAAQDSNVSMNRMVTGIFSAVRTILIFSAQSIARRKLSGAFEEKRQSFLRKTVLAAYVSQLNTLLGWVVQYGMQIAAFTFVYLGKLSIGQVTTMLFITEFLTAPMFQIIDIKNMIAGTRDVRKRLEAILNEPDECAADPLPPAAIELRDVSFQYSDAPFMTDINLSFAWGKRYLIVGQSGSGKSTLLRLLLKELAPTSGTITYGGADIAAINRSTWYQSIAYTGQKIEILPGTLRENIILDKPYDEVRLNEILGWLNLDSLSGKLDLPLSEDLSNFSGGELQRVAIARMLYDDSPIFIFDEFSSSLDNVNAHRIEEELLEIEGKLLISVTHRLQPDLLGKYEQIIIMEDGRVKHAGRPDEVDLRPFLTGAGAGADENGEQKAGPSDCGEKAPSHAAAAMEPV